ncbi:hypothetical protein VKT23_010068 [Stygiomarasmius scandens]|uniref:BTB domain-containing protein n=1 Tax=Marasmiellus scandens TaxID=2682957 RepID=A0ABR1JH19_9AGAR
MQSRAPSPNSRITLNLNVSGATIDIKPGQSQQKRIRSRQSVTIEGQLKMSTKFPIEDPENDWLCRSNDGLLYGLRIENARINSENIYDPESPDSPIDDIAWHKQIDLPSTICDLLFEYLYNRPRTNLETVPFNILVDLTHAAEEYMVQSAIDACKNALRKHIPENALDVMRVAGKYGYNEEMIRAAPFLIDTALHTMNTVLPPNLHMAWCCYREQFTATHRFASEAYTNDHKCQVWNGILLEVFKRLRGEPGDILGKIEKIFEDMIDKVIQKGGVDACCVAPLKLWRETIVNRRDAHEVLQIPN